MWQQWLENQETLTRIVLVIPTAERSAICDALYTDGWRITHQSCLPDETAETMSCDPTRYRIVAEKLSGICEVVIQGERCCLPAGHDGGHRWAGGD